MIDNKKNGFSNADFTCKTLFWFRGYSKAAYRRTPQKAAQNNVIHACWFVLTALAFRSLDDRLPAAASAWGLPLDVSTFTAKYGLEKNQTRDCVQCAPAALNRTQRPSPAIPR
jgi:hypothetical protein